MPWTSGDTLGPTNLNARSYSGVVFNVMDPTFGAKGDGVTDDWLSIQTALNKASSSTATARCVYLPSGYTYSISSALTMSGSGMELRGEGFGSVILFANNMKFYAPASGQSAGIYVSAITNTAIQQNRVHHLKIDGNRFNQTIPNACLMFDGGNGVNPDEVAGTDLQIVNGYGTVAYGSLLRVQNVFGGQFSNIFLRNGASDGMNIFGGCQKIQVTNLDSRLNGQLGLDIEPGGGNRPADIQISNYFASENSGQNLGVLSSDDVVLNNISTLTGGNNGNIQIRGCNRVLMSNFKIRGAAGAKPVGLALDGENTTDTNTDILLFNGSISSCISHGIMVNNTQNLTIVGVSSSSNGGYGLSLNTSGTTNLTVSTVTALKVIGSYFSYNGLGTISGISWVSAAQRAVALNTPMDTDAIYLGPGSAILPVYSFGSETSLGFYRSAASTLAQSWGSIQLAPNIGDRVSIGSATAGDILGVRNDGTGRVGITVTNGVSGTGNSAHQVFVVDGAAGTLVNEMFSTAFAGVGNQAWVYATGTAPLVLGSAGAERLRLQSGGTILASQPIYHQDGSAVQPQVGFGSELSLGLFKSANSTIAVSYGTLTLNQAYLASVKTATSVNSTILGANAIAIANPGVSGASICLNINGVMYIFNSSSTTIGK